MTSFKRYLITGGLLLGSLTLPALASADETATPVPTPTPLAWYQKVTVGGYVDAYYQLDLNTPAATGSPKFRAYDNQMNQFTYGGGELTLKQNDASSGTGYFVDLLMGGAMGSTFGNSSSADSVSIGQAYLTQTLGNATFTLGKFYTPMGYEVTSVNQDANFSRSLLWQQEPTFSTGLRLDYNLPGSLVASAYVDNGNSVDNAAANGKGFGGILAYSGVKNLNLTALYYNNEQQFPTGLGGATDGLYDTQWGNFIATYTATNSLSFAGEYLLKDYSLLGNNAYDAAAHLPGVADFDPIQQGYALYATYDLSTNLSLSPRFEQWYNPTFGNTLYSTEGSDLGLTAAPGILDDYTLTLKYQMGPLSHILEYRCDATSMYNVNNGTGGFTTVNGNKPHFMSTVQQTLTYAAIYSF